MNEEQEQKWLSENFTFQDFFGPQTFAEAAAEIANEMKSNG